jgi:hypothetical protein
LLQKDAKEKFFFLLYDRTPITHLLTTFLSNYVFSPQITRNTPDVLPKPDPAGLLHIAKEWKLDNRAENLIMVCFPHFRFFILPAFVDSFFEC